MVDGIEDGVAANGVTTYMEEEARRYFESGKATFMRNWPYAYELGNAKGSTVRGKFDVAPLPSFEGGGKAGILGGHDMVISVFSENPGAALKFIDFVTSRDQQLLTLRDYSQAAVISDVYDDPAVRTKYPFAEQLRDAVGQAKSRPVSPVYPQISQAIYENVSAALEGSVTPAQALEDAQADIDKALQTFLALVALRDPLAVLRADLAVVADLHEVVARPAVDPRGVLRVPVDDVVAVARVDAVLAAAREPDRVRARAAGDEVGGHGAAALQVVVAVAAVDVGGAAA
jgi:hypothetical protein